MAATTVAVVNDDDDLDPVGLQKAIRFASLSSIALVSNF
jgi:hypothetical protein